MSSNPAAQKRIHTLDEILAQPRCWSECLRDLSTAPQLSRAVAMASPEREWLLLGCGSSYYLALAAAATCNWLGLPTRAVPASELLLYPELVMMAGREYLPIMISRSGLTSEVVRAAGVLENGGIKTIAVTCTDGQPLEENSTVALKLLAVREQSTVMTQSFTSMLLALQYLGALSASNEKFCNDLVRLPEQVAEIIELQRKPLRAFVNSNDFADYVCLAQGPLFGIASEAMLKVTESSCSYAQVFHTMEFRHGPKSIVGPETLIAFFLSETSYLSELEVLEEMRELGASTLVIGNRLESRARDAANFAIEMGLEVPEYARLAAYTIWGQLLGVYTGLKKGLNPDSPRNLSRVVVLDGNG